MGVANYSAVLHGSRQSSDWHRHCCPPKKYKRVARIFAAHAESHNGGSVQPAGAISMRFRVAQNLHGWHFRMNLSLQLPRGSRLWR